MGSVLLEKGRFSARERKNVLAEMAVEKLDLLVIGGGITGAGIAWDAAVRGMKVGLLEMGDFASGTSSKSTKLVHGGLRYLKQGEVKLVREVGKEREILHRNAPHIVIPAPMLMPIYKGGTYGYWASSVGLYVYDWLAGVKPSERRRMLSREETIRTEPMLKQEGLIGAGYYYEYRTDDARLTVDVMKTAQMYGARIVNYARVTDFLYEQGKAAGVRCTDEWTGESYEILAEKMVNAAGPWVDRLRQKDGSLSGKRLLLTKGVHLVVDYSRLPVRQAAYFDVPDGRMIFAIPRDGKTYIGTTDTVYEGRIENPRTTKADRDYLIHAVNSVFPEAGLGEDDIESSWAGLRPLIGEKGKAPSEISRKDEIFISASGLISIAGGKLTGFRKMAQKVVDSVAAQLKAETGIGFPACSTDRIVISGGDKNGFPSFEDCRVNLTERGIALDIERQTIERLLSLYGSNVGHIYREYEDEINRVEEGFSDGSADRQERDRSDRILCAEVRYCVEHEMAASVADFLVRRTGMLNFDRPRAEREAERVTEVMADILGWAAVECEKQRCLIGEQIQAAVHASERDETGGDSN